MEVRRIAEIATWVGLFLLIPGTALGYFSEGSLPGQPLYPLKRGIEQVALTAQSFNSQAKALYEVELANRRLSESTKLLASNEPVYNFSDVYAQIAEAKASISTISDTTERKQAEQKLADTITLYQQQLTNIQSASPSNGTARSFLTPTPTPSSHPSNAGSSSENPTPTSSPDNASNSNTSQIDDFNSELQQIKDNLTSDQTSPTPSPTPTTILSPTATPTPVPHLPVFTNPLNGQPLKKGSWVHVTVTVLNGNSKDKLTIYVDGNKLCSGTFSASCYWQVPSHYNEHGSGFTLLAQNIDSLGNTTTKSITVYLSNAND